MKHDCRIGYLETSEDDEGYLYLEWKRAFGSNTGKFKIEFCPVCGTKAKKSSIEHLTLFPREDVENPLKTGHDHIMDMFRSACDALIEHKMDDPCFQFCFETVVHTLNYLKAKRKE